MTKERWESIKEFMKPSNQTPTEEHEKIRQLVLSEYRKGNIVFETYEGLMTSPIEEFIKQPSEGMLFDLNRDEPTVLTFISRGEPTWINNYAVAKVIHALKDSIQSLQSELSIINQQNSDLQTTIGNLIAEQQQSEKKFEALKKELANEIVKSNLLSGGGF